MTTFLWVFFIVVSSLIGIFIGCTIGAATESGSSKKNLRNGLYEIITFIGVSKDKLGVELIVEQKKENEKLQTDAPRLYVKASFDDFADPSEKNMGIFKTKLLSVSGGKFYWLP